MYQYVIFSVERSKYFLFSIDCTVCSVELSVQAPITVCTTNEAKKRLDCSYSVSTLESFLGYQFKLSTQFLA